MSPLIIDPINTVRICRQKIANVEPTYEEWEAKPSSPESIRLISMGKMLNDKTRLAGKTAIPSSEIGIR